MRDQLKLIRNKIITPAEITPLLGYWKYLKDKVVFTNGCFDLLHRGHVEYLAKAASLGDHLLIGLNTDASVRRLKGQGRPLVDEQSRAFVLSALSFVAHVIFFDEDTPEKLIQQVAPDVLVKGGDYKEDEIVGSEFVKANGGEVEVMPLLEGFSTSDLVGKIRGNH